MNAEDIILAHMRWKIKFSAYCSRPDSSALPDAFASDDCCELGRWLYGIGIKHCALPEYVRLRDAHAKFHACAAEALQKIEGDQALPPEKLIGADSEFGRASAAIIAAIKTLAEKIS